jgi:hypothetical protein
MSEELILYILTMSFEMKNAFSPLGQDITVSPSEQDNTVSPSGQDILGEPELLKTCPWCLACCENYKDNNSTPDSPFHKPRDCEHLVTWLLLQFISLGCCWQEAWDNEPAITFKDFQHALAFVPFFWEYCERADLLDREVEREKKLELKRAADEERSILDHVNVLFINKLIDIWAVVQDYVENMKEIASERYKKDKRDREHSAARGKMNSELQIYEDMVVRLLASIFEIFPQDHEKMRSNLVKTMENVRGVIQGQQLNDMFDLATEFIASLKKEVAALKPEPATPKPATTVPLAAAVKKLSLDPEGYEKVTRRRPKEEKKFHQRILIPCRHCTTYECQAVDAKKVKKNKLNRRSRYCLNAHADDLKPCDRENRRYGCGCRCVNPNCRSPKIRLCSYDTGNRKPVLMEPGQTAECATMCCRGVHVKKNPDMIRVGKDSVIIATPENIKHAFALIDEESAKRKADAARRKADAETRRINSEKAEEKNPSHKKVTQLKAATDHRLKAATDHNRDKQKAANELRKKREADAQERAIYAAAPLKALFDASPETTILNRNQKQILLDAGYSGIVNQCDENVRATKCSLCRRKKDVRYGDCLTCDYYDSQDEMGGGM